MKLTPRAAREAVAAMRPQIEAAREDARRAKDDQQRD
jgi:outer membrane murein-binding lipoprotein Lpp